MAIFHLSMTRASRKVGRSAVAMIAYRAGERLVDERTGEIHDYSRKEVLRAELITPTGGPSWTGTREEFWNASEFSHNRKDAIVAREIELSLPFEATQDQRERMGIEFAQHVSDRFNVPVDACFHPPSSKQGDPRNYHVHILICTRPLDDESRTGFGGVVREFDAIARRQSNDAALREPIVEDLRREWTEILNRERERARDGQRDFLYDLMDHRSFKRQGIEREPTIKLGRASTDMQRRGEDNERAQHNEDVRHRNDLLSRALNRTIERTHSVGPAPGIPQPDCATDRPRSAIEQWLETIEVEYEPAREGPETFERSFEP